jgi:HicB-like protein involved in pilus formation
MSGYTNPVPTKDSAKLNLRMPPALHRQLQETAAEQGMSLNTWIVMLLAGSIGFTLDTREARESTTTPPEVMGKSTTVPTEVMGKNNKISRKQRASLMRFLASPQGLTWQAGMPHALIEQMAMHSWSRCGDAGKQADERFVAAWKGWVASLPEDERPRRNHMWSKGACVLMLGY